ncbi:MAG TPA: DUF1343 domain-containing protein [Cyclobacteriaceae bacterium]|nr:DUF1343 domain-containing protein [Cyclobacteriaceae bacterium]
MTFRLSLLILIFLQDVYGQENRLIVGAERPDQYLRYLENKNVGVVVNHTSRAFGTHLVEMLISNKVNIVKIFTPEHGYRGIADAGQHLSDAIDEQTGIAVVSLYGEKTKPLPADLNGIDIIVFDIQDVGVRFYTYISTLHLVMEACAENGIELVVLDRPNPNGDYVDGPVIQDSLKSFVGLDPLPIVYGLTIGELAGMINGEKWLSGALQCKLKVIPISNYNHNTRYSLPYRPSPNLPNDQSIRLYPSLCLFEGTIMSLGRGTEFPFQVVGYPDSISGDFVFTPVGTEGNANPKYKGRTCFGKDYQGMDPVPNFSLSFIIDFYYKLGKKYDFFNDYFDKLAGNSELRKQIIAGFSEEEIRITWAEDLSRFKELRNKYLLYP